MLFAIRILARLGLRSGHGACCCCLLSLTHERHVSPLSALLSMLLSEYRTSRARARTAPDPRALRPSVSER